MRPALLNERDCFPIRMLTVGEDELRRTEGFDDLTICAIVVKSARSSASGR